jgi:hypothetical protein
VRVPELEREIELTVTRAAHRSPEPVTDGGYLLPPRFTVEARLDDALTVALRAEVRKRRLYLMTFEVSAGKAGIPLEARFDRVPIRALLEEGAALVAAEHVIPRISKVSSPIEADPAARARFRRALRFHGRTKKRRSRDEIDQTLKRVAEVYLTADRAPVQAVMSAANEWGPISRATASRWIRDARAAGYFDAPPRTGGFDEECFP